MAVVFIACLAGLWVVLVALNSDVMVQPSVGPALAPPPPPLALDPSLAPSALGGTDPDADAEALRTYAALEQISRLR
jgi:hypothetical protein